MRENQKQRERRYLDRFRECYADFPSGEIVHSERPDFILLSDDLRLGIEVSEVFQPGPDHGGSPQAQESLQTRTLHIASDIHLRNGGPFVDVAIQFARASDLTKRRVDRLARDLAELVGESRAEIGEVIRLGDEDDLPEEIASLRIFRLPSLSRSHWNAAGAITVPRLDPPAIQDILNRKTSLLPGYLNHCDVCWLLLIADGFQFSGSVDVSESAYHHAFDSPFDRVLFFQVYERRIIRLFTFAPLVRDV